MKPDLNSAIEYFNNLNEQLRYGLLGLAVIIVIVLDVFLLVLPQIGSIAHTNQDIKKLSEDIQKVHTDKERIDQLRKNLKATRVQLSAKVRAIQEVPVILSTISSIANVYKVKIDQLVPEKGQQETLASDADGKYYGLPILIRAHCGYHMFGHFLNNLENGDFDFIMKDFIIQNNDKDPGTHLFSLTIQVILVDKALTKNI
jgi:Tfp pilus assembly protein PilO